MINDAKWYANWIRLLDASTPDEKMRNLEAADMLEQLEAAQTKWISVDERLPDRPGKVLICIHDYVGIAWYNDYCFEFGNGMKFAVDYPNACWMPLPQPPKE